jgi:hypothetical protein
MFSITHFTRNNLAPRVHLKIVNGKCQGRYKFQGPPEDQPADRRRMMVKRSSDLIRRIAAQK